MAKKGRPPKKAIRTTTNSTKRTKPRRKSGTRKRSSNSRRVWLGLGSNLGDRRAFIESALEEISRIASLRRVSALYATEPVGDVEQPDFFNAAAEILWRGSPEEILAAVKAIERKVGRRPTHVNGPREIDVDILDFGGAIRTDSDPILPHPRLSARRFALAPLAEIAPRWRHPISRLTARQLLKRLPVSPSVRRLNIRPDIRRIRAGRPY
ncbi:MAG TPA: 2-amino-4-hydroxy-6-hydroxymethyldihydropteridine diphosphokinase [Thermoanaerobaculia bacterium]